MMKLWERHLFLRLFKTMALLLCGLFCIYMVVDLSVHSVRFLGAGKAGLGQLLFYYFHGFSLYLDLFLSIAYLLGLLRVYFEMAHHAEFIALHMAGLSIRRLSRPLFLLAALFCLLSYANAEWLSPSAHNAIEQFRAKVAKRKNAVREHVQALGLEDGSEIVYQSFDPVRKTLFDVYWIRTKDELWHIKTIDCKAAPLRGRCVDVLTRNDKGQFALERSWEMAELTELPLIVSEAFEKFVPFDQRPLLSLLRQSLVKGAEQDMNRAHLHYKLTQPLLPFLIALVLPPILLRFSRNKHTFLISSCSLFAIVSFLTLLDGMLMLAENRVFDPLFAIWFPWLAAFVAALCRPLRRSSSPF